MPRLLRLPLAAFVALVCGAAPAVAQDDLIVPVGRADAIQRGLSTAAFSARGTALTPCEQDKPIAFGDVRDIRSTWAGRFRLQRQGTGGAWTLVVESGDGTTSQEWPVGEGGVTAGAEWVAGPFRGTQVRIALKGPATAPAACPLIQFAAEMQAVVPGRARGLVGPDKRWKDESAELNAAPDVAALKRWRSSVAFVEIFASSTSIIPCTGFFISAHVLMTAAHCVGSTLDASRAQIRIGTRIVGPAEIKLVMAQAMDFALIWINGDAQPDTLALGSGAAPADLVVWQRPAAQDTRISVVGCVASRVSAMKIEHKCDTTGGASGAPVQLRATGEVIGLHILGCFDTSGTLQCVNEALPTVDIKARILALEQKLRAADPVAAGEILAAVRGGGPTE